MDRDSIKSVDPDILWRPKDKLLKTLKKIYKKSSAVKFFNFLDIKSLDPDLYSAKRLAPDPESMNPNPQHWLNELPKNSKNRYPVAW